MCPTVPIPDIVIAPLGEYDWGQVVGPGILTSRAPANIVPDVTVEACPADTEHPKSLNMFTVAPVIVKSTLNGFDNVNLNVLVPKVLPINSKVKYDDAGGAPVVVVVLVDVVVDVGGCVVDVDVLVVDVGGCVVEVDVLVVVGYTITAVPPL